jgi:CII-binding regulator of phage lambda lysogenization HflD
VFVTAFATWILARRGRINSEAGIKAVNERLTEATRGISDFDEGRNAVLAALANLRKDILAGKFA